jgi:ribosomal protein S18 acetylase RimI-like enzyme
MLTMATHQRPATSTEVGAVITPARPEDLDALVALFRRSTETTRRERFHGATRRLPCPYFHDIVAGASSVVARVARDLSRDPAGTCVIGLATATFETPDRAELAVWVDDQWQRHGVGSRLLRGVIDQLRVQGVDQAVAYVEPANVGAVSLAHSLARSLGIPVPGGTDLTFDLSRVPREAIA